MGASNDPATRERPCDVRAKLVAELVAWLEHNTFELLDAGDERDLAWRKGWNAAKRDAIGFLTMGDVDAGLRELANARAVECMCRLLLPCSIHPDVEVNRARETFEREQSAIEAAYLAFIASEVA